MEIRKEHKELTAEKKGLKSLIGSEDLQWKAIAEEIAETKKLFGPKTQLGRRRTTFGEAAELPDLPLETAVEREPVTVVMSEKGWIRTLRGHQPDDGKAAYKEGDKGRFWIHCETTDKIMLFGTDGRFYTLPVDKLPGGRGHGEPVRLLIDLGNDRDVVTLFAHKPGRKLLVAATDGRGFVVPEDEAVASTRGGKQVLNVSGDVEACVCVPAEGDHVASLGDNRKLLIFKLSEVPEMGRGRGVILQKFKDGGLADAKVFTLKEGLTWITPDGRERTETEIRDWIGERAQAGRLPPKGFNKVNTFGKR